MQLQIVGQQKIGYEETEDDFQEQEPLDADDEGELENSSREQEDTDEEKIERLFML